MNSFMSCSLVEICWCFAEFFCFHCQLYERSRRELLNVINLCLQSSQLKITATLISHEFSLAQYYLNGGQNHNNRVTNRLFENVVKFKYCEQHTNIVSNTQIKNYIYKEIKNRLNSENPVTIWSTIYCPPICYVKI